MAPSKDHKRTSSTETTCKRGNLSDNKSDDSISVVPENLCPKELREHNNLKFNGYWVIPKKKRNRPTNIYSVAESPASTLGVDESPLNLQITHENNDDNDDKHFIGSHICTLYEDNRESEIWYGNVIAL